MWNYFHFSRYLDTLKEASGKDSLSAVEKYVMDKVGDSFDYTAVLAQLW